MIVHPVREHRGVIDDATFLFLDVDSPPAELGRSTMRNSGTSPRAHDSRLAGINRRGVRGVARTRIIAFATGAQYAFPRLDAQRGKEHEFSAGSGVGGCLTT